MRNVAARSYRNPRFYDSREKQTIVFSSPIRAYQHIVRDMQQRTRVEDGTHTYGWVRHQGGDYAVKKCVGSMWEGQNAWKPTDNFSVADLRHGTGRGLGGRA